MITPTSPKPHTPADPTVSKDAGTTLDKRAADAGLRTALTKAIDRADPPGGMRAGTPSISVPVLRALLDAHPAPPVVDEAEVRERIARQLDAEQRRARAAHLAAPTDHFAHDYCRWVGHAEALGNAARIVRGATR